MANYYGNTRTNYFRVVDKDKYESIMDSVRCSEGELHLWEEEINGELHFGFGVYDDINGICECEHCIEVQDGKAEFDEDECMGEYNYDKMCALLASVVHPEDAVIIVSSGHEKLKFVGGYSTIITKDEIKHIDLWSDSIKSARKILNNEKYTTTYAY